MQYNLELRQDDWLLKPVNAVPMGRVDGNGRYTGPFMGVVHFKATHQDPAIAKRDARDFTKALIVQLNQAVYRENLTITSEDLAAATETVAQGRRIKLKWNAGALTAPGYLPPYDLRKK